jgi:hypothetical protein
MVCALAALVLLGAARPALAAAEPVTMTDYTDRSEAINWGQRSHWKQPWRSYLDTVPATTLLSAIGINFNVKPKFAAATARLLGDAGFSRARLEVGWGTLDYEDPSRMNAGDRKNLATTLTALRENGIRPLILLNANSGKPCPVKPGTVTLTAPAAAGDTEIHLDPADLAQVAPGRTGIDSAKVAAATLFTATEPDGTVWLSKPLEAGLPAGELRVTTLRYEPFRPAKLEDGEPNPAAAATLQGWEDYVAVVAREARAILGSDQFDVEVWNELSFGSAFLNFNGYYEPGPEWSKRGAEGAMLERTAAYLRDPAHGFADVGIGNGFASESPWWSGTKSLPGITAIDKHPYAGWHSFPAEAEVNGNRPLNGLGEPSGWWDTEHQYHEDFTPAYEDFFPEHFLSGIQTETLVRDLAPYPSPIQGVPHGRYTHPEGGPPPQVWITEVGLGPGSGPTPRSQMSAADIRRIETKDVLRYLVAYVNKGVTALDLYGADAGDLSVVDPGFFAAAKADPSAYPGDAAGGETVAAVARLTAALHGAGPLSDPRSLSLRELTDFEANVQFKGNGTVAFPPLYNRDVFAFLPFQVSDDRFVVPVYVMTRNVAEEYDPAGPGQSRFELPAEPYRLAIGGIDGETATVAATDPVSGAAVPVEVVGRGPEEVVVQLPVTDSPRLLEIEDGGCQGCEAAEPGAGTEGGEEAGAPSTEAAEEGSGRAAKERHQREGEEVAPLAPSLRLRGQADLLDTRSMTVLARCRATCRLSPHGRVLIAGVRYPMAVAPGGGAVEAGPQQARLQLTIGAGLARRGQRALHQGVRVKLIVGAQAHGVGSGAEANARAVFVLTR